MKRILVFLCVALSGVVQGADNAPADAQAVRAALQQFNDAARKGDEATLNRLLSPDLIYIHSNARPENKAECVAAVIQSKPDFQMVSTPRVNVYGNTAVLHARMVANVMQNNAPAKLDLDLMQVWVKSGASWQMVARHTSRVMP